MLVNDYNTIAELSKRIMSAVPSPLIFLTPGYSEDTELIRSLRRSGVFNFITATSLAGLKSDLIRALEGRNSPLPPPADPGNPSSEMPVIHALLRINHRCCRLLGTDRNHYPGNPASKTSDYFKDIGLLY